MSNLNTLDPEMERQVLRTLTLNTISTLQKDLEEAEKSIPKITIEYYDYDQRCSKKLQTLLDLQNDFYVKVYLQTDTYKTHACTPMIKIVNNNYVFLCYLHWYRNDKIFLSEQFLWQIINIIKKDFEKEGKNLDVNIVPN